MRKNISISNFNKTPLGVVLTLALFILTESFIYYHRPDLITDYWNKFLINERNLIDQPKDYDYLIMGDSIQKTGIDPTTVNDKILNLGLPGAKPMGQYLILERYLEKHKPPRAIFLFIDPEFERDSLFVILRYFVNIPEFFSIWRDLTWRERQIFIMRYWASLDMRKTGLTKRDTYPYPNAVFVGEMKKNQGYMPSPGTDKSIENDYFAANKELRRQDKISIATRDMRYLDKLIDLARSRNIKVIFFGYFIPKELYDIFEKNGFIKDNTRFINELKLRYPEAVFTKDFILHLDNSYFGDASHLNKNGMKIYTDYFMNQVFAPNAN